MTFEDRKKPGKDWKKSQEKREELHDRDNAKANNPKSIYKQVDEEIRKEEKKTDE